MGRFKSTYAHAVVRRVHLTEASVRYIHSQINTPTRALAKELGVSATAVHNVRVGNTWATLHPEYNRQPGQNANLSIHQPPQQTAATPYFNPYTQQYEATPLQDQPRYQTTQAPAAPTAYPDVAALQAQAQALLNNQSVYQPPTVEDIAAADFGDPNRHRELSDLIDSL